VTGFLGQQPQESLRPFPVHLLSVPPARPHITPPPGIRGPRTPDPQRPLAWVGGSADPLRSYGLVPGRRDGEVRARGPDRRMVGQARAGHVAGIWTRGWRGARAGRAGQAAGDRTARWPARARASTMVTAAAISTAPTVIRMICQPGTPVAAAWEAVGTGPKRPS
jgi:hypothetical protein